ncbi:DUF805 domain-containing protein [Geothrix limicola]|uniref:DUF805 domain-containing protein n=1 Tax=Geothrix limicola TaxID=2927978 RepID=UPI0025543A1C|nr:DUF805 domain-containing protein [Geothrix limicola]
MPETKLFSAAGRINRSFFIVQYALTLLAYGITRALIDFSASLAVSIPLLLIFVAVGFSMVCTSIKRLHDLNHSGFLYLLMFIPIVNLLLLIYLAAKPSNNWKNEYGLNPLLPPANCPTCGRQAFQPPGRYTCSDCGQRFELDSNFTATAYQS